MQLETTPTPCPQDDCQATFDCDACLDAHLRADHEASYLQVYGAVPETWLGLCTRHTTLEPERVGGVPATPAGA